MSDAEIVARALSTQIGPAPRRCFEDGDCREFAEIIVAALAEAGRLVPEGYVCIDAGRWERVMTVLNDCAAASVIEMVDDAMATLDPGDLDA